MKCIHGTLIITPIIPIPSNMIRTRAVNLFPSSLIYVACLSESDDDYDGGGDDDDDDTQRQVHLLMPSQA